MNAADTSASSAIADCTPLTVVSRSRTTDEIDTFMRDVSTTSTNIAAAKRSASLGLPADSCFASVVASSPIRRHHAAVMREAQGAEPGTAAAEPRPHPSEAVREAVTMALYVSIVLGAEFVAVVDLAEEEPSTIGAIWGTAIGVALAHVFAFNLA